MKLNALLFTLCLSGAALFDSLQAAPAFRRLIELNQPDGTKIIAMPWGDEWSGGLLNATTGEKLILDQQTKFWRAMTREESATAEEEGLKMRRTHSVAAGQRYLGGVPHLGSLRVPLVAVEFTDQKLNPKFGADMAFMDSTLNSLTYERVSYEYSNVQYKAGSARRYFRTQSYGKFDPYFDILKPIQLDHNVAYYGKDNNGSRDTNYQALLKDVAEKLTERGDLDDVAQYDANGDGVIDIVYIIYAGWNQNEISDQTDYIWAKTTPGYNLRTSKGTYIHSFCITSELRGLRPSDVVPSTYETAGIGVFSHEFGHALGLPDLYCTDASIALQVFGMDSWSLMDQGEYNGRSHIPAPFTLHERMQMGWVDEPRTASTVGRDTLDPISIAGDGLILRNPANPNEFLTFENHQPTDLWEKCWGNSAYFSATTNKGLLITHIDYDRQSWNNNQPNLVLDHQRCNPLPADGELTTYNIIEEANKKYYDNQTDENLALLKEAQNTFTTSLRSDIFPGYRKITTLNASNPRACWYTGDSIDIDITNVEQLADGRIVITFGNPTIDDIHSVETKSETPHSGKVVWRNGQFTVNGYNLYGIKVE